MKKAFVIFACIAASILIGIPASAITGGNNIVASSAIASICILLFIGLVLMASSYVAYVFDPGCSLCGDLMSYGIDIVIISICMWLAMGIIWTL